MAMHHCGPSANLDQKKNELPWPNSLQTSNLHQQQQQQFLRDPKLNSSSNIKSSSSPHSQHLNLAQQQQQYGLYNSRYSPSATQHSPLASRVDQNVKTQLQNNNNNNVVINKPNHLAPSSSALNFAAEAAAVAAVTHANMSSASMMPQNLASPTTITVNPQPYLATPFSTASVSATSSSSSAASINNSTFNSSSSLSTSTNPHTVTSFSSSSTTTTAPFYANSLASLDAATAAAAASLIGNSNHIADAGLSTNPHFNNGSAVTNNNNSSNNNSQAKLPAHSASHSALVAAAALQSLNQPHLNRSLQFNHHHLQQLQQLAYLQQSSNGLPPPDQMLNQSQANSINKLAAAAATSLAASTPASPEQLHQQQQMNHQSIMESNQIAMRSLPYNNNHNNKSSQPSRPQLGAWPSPMGAGNNSMPIANSRWPFSNTPIPAHLISSSSPNSTPTFSTGTVNNSSNSNTMIGQQDADNHSHTFGHRKKTDRQSNVTISGYHPPSRSQPPVTEHDKSMFAPQNNLYNMNMNLNLSNQSIKNMPFSSSSIAAPQNHPQEHIMNNIDKSRTTSQSPNEINPRSHSTNIPSHHRHMSSHTGNIHALPTNPHNPSSLIGHRIQLPSAHSRQPSSFLSTMNGSQSMSGLSAPSSSFPSRSHSVSVMAHAHEPPYGASSQARIRQPPAAHQSSTIRSSAIITPMNVSRASLPSNMTQQPLTAHLSSKTPLTPRLQTQNNIHPTVKQSFPSPDKSTEDRLVKSHSIYSGARFEGEQLASGLPIQNLNNLKQQQELSLKRFGTENPGIIGAAHMANFEMNRMPCSIDTRLGVQQSVVQQNRPSNQLVGDNVGQKSVSQIQPNPTIPNAHMHSIYLDQNRGITFVDSQKFGPLDRSMNISTEESDMKQYFGPMAAHMNQQISPSSRINQKSSTHRAPSIGSLGLTNNSQIDHLLSIDEHNPLEISDQQSSSPKSHNQKGLLAGRAIQNSKKVKKFKHNSQTARRPEDGASDSSTLHKPLEATSIKLESRTNYGDTGAAQCALSLNVVDQAPISSCESGIQQMKSEPEPSSLPTAIDQVKSDDTKPDADSALKLSADKVVTGVERRVTAEMTMSDSGLSGSSLNLCDTNSADENFDDAAISTPNGAIICQSKILDTSSIDNTPRKPDVQITAACDTKKENLVSGSKLHELPTGKPSEPSKYTKMYTKKAWIQNYDQEDQARVKVKDTEHDLENNNNTNNNNNKSGASSNNFENNANNTVSMKSSRVSSNNVTLETLSNSESPSAPAGNRFSSRTRTSVRNGNNHVTKPPPQSPKLESKTDKTDRQNDHRKVSKRPASKNHKHKSKKTKTTYFLQTDPCYEKLPKGIRCLECRKVRQSSAKRDRRKSGLDYFCRFYEFRKLEYVKGSQVVVAGFSEVSDAKESDMRLWLPSKDSTKNMNLDVAKFILSHVGDEFCSLVRSERTAYKDYLENSTREEKKVNWKKIVNGVRELCDVCATTLFNYHYVCERCGFVVCIDCHRERAEIKLGAKKNGESGTQINSDPCELVIPVDEQTDNQDSPATNAYKKAKKDACGWVFCAKNEEHIHTEMTLSQIIPGDCLETVWSLLHEIRRKRNLGTCSCEVKANSKTGPMDVATSNGSHSTLEGLLLAQGSEDNCDTKKQHDDNVPAKLNGFSETNQIEDSDKTHLEPELQEDLKLAEQVSAALDACLSSIPLCRANSDAATEVTETNHEHLYSWLYNDELLVLSEGQNPENSEIFEWHWKNGRPVVVRGSHKLMDLKMWLPQFFGKEFGQYSSDLVDCRNGDIHRHSMKKYWEGFEPIESLSKKRTKDSKFSTPTSNNEECSNGPSYYSGSALWRLKDWPPGQDFNEILPSHYEDFMNNLPIRRYTTRNGELNLACRLPKEMLKPDLGPKMYSAYGTPNFPERGTTNLHLDMSDAINVMVYVGGAKQYSSGSEEMHKMFERTINECHVDDKMKKDILNNKLVPGALWHIFKPSDATSLRMFLNKVADERKISHANRTDPIHDQTWYLDQALLDRLEKEHGVRSYAILQCMGDSIIIPAGAPHQVKNVHNCIKVANDFVSPENIRYCLQLTSEFRSLPDTHINQEDKLQVKNILYHSIKESLQYLKSCKGDETDLKKESSNESMDSE